MNVENRVKKELGGAKLAVVKERQDAMRLAVGYWKKKYPDDFERILKQVKKKKKGAEN